MMPYPENVVEQTIGWLIAVNAEGFDSWEALTAWLEQHPDHAAAFAELSAREREFSELAAAALAARPRAVDAAPAQAAARGWRGAAGAMRPWRRAAVAATVMAGVIGLTVSLYRPAAADQVLETRPGELRELRLAGGIRVWVNGATTLRYAAADPVRFELVRGEALFEVRHDPARKVTVSAGGWQADDIGTTFNVAHAGGVTQFGVAEGSLRLTGEGLRAELRGGDIVRHLADGTTERLTVPGSDVTGWIHGRLAYRGARLGQVAGDLSRQIGVKITVAAALDARQFTGGFQVVHDPRQQFERIGPLLGVRAVREGSGWQLVDAHIAVP